MEVSIIIPVYNVENYIADCLHSVMNQTVTEGVECILVDDCGDDSSMEFAERLISQYSGNIKFSILHHKKNKGLSGARNTGMSAAVGKYLYFLDSDDEITDDCIESLYSRVIEEDFDVVIGDYKVIGSSERFQKLAMSTGTSYKEDEIPWSYEHGKWMQVAWNKLYRTTFIRNESLEFKEGLIHEDELWSLEVAAVAKKICGVNKETYIYKIRDNSITTASTASNTRKAHTLVTIYKEYFDFLLVRGLITNPPRFHLLLMAFEAAINKSRTINKSSYRSAFKECHKHTKISVVQYIQITKSNLFFLLKNLFVILPFPVSFWYFVFLHDYIGNLKRRVAIR